MKLREHCQVGCRVNHKMLPAVQKIYSYFYTENNLLLRQLLLCICPGKQNQKKPKTLSRVTRAHKSQSAEYEERDAHTDWSCNREHEDMTLHDEGVRLLGLCPVTIPGMVETSVNQGK